jgi:hypothetical protein
MRLLPITADRARLLSIEPGRSREPPPQSL